MCQTILNLLAIIVSAIATAFIAYFSYRSNQLSKEIKDISLKTFELSNAIEIQNKNQQENVNKIFWAIVFSNVLTDKANRKERVGFLIKLFGWETIQRNTNISKEDLKSVVNANCAKFIDDLFNS